MPKDAPKIVIFDMDGVLLKQTAPVLAVRQALASKKFEWDYEAIRGLEPIDLIRIFEECDSSKTIGFLTEIHKKFAPYLPGRYKRWLFFKHLGQKLRAYEKRFGEFFEGAVETITLLHQNGVIMGICTNGEGDRTDRWLKRYGLSDIIKYKTTRDTKRLYGLKPSPGPLIALLIEIAKSENVRIDRNKVYFVGDNVSDIRAAKNGLMRSIAVLSGNGRKNDLIRENPDFIIDSVANIPEINEIFE